MNRLECHLTAAHYFVIKNSDPDDHRDVGQRMQEYLKWRNKNTQNPKLTKDVALDIALPSLEEAFEVRGTIRTTKGEPMSEVGISAYDENTGSFSTSISYPGGTYSLVLPSGTYDFTLNPLPFGGPQFSEQHVENVVVEGYTIRDITVDI